MTIFISDLHLGNIHSQAGRFYTWLERQDHNQTIYLVGDIFDDYRMMEWPRSHKNALLAILAFSEIYYTPGNHDKFWREIGVLMFDKIRIANELSYVAGDDKIYLVLHGDEQDWMMRYAFISSRFIGHKIRSWFSKLHTRLTGSQDAMIQYVKDKGYDGVICGHTHDAEIATIDGIEYINCGDFVTSCTAVVESKGKFTIVQV